MNTSVICTVPTEEIQKLKGLGFLRDKTTADCFNCRVITRNGRLTSSELSHIAEAARRFGSGIAAMTTRQTIEIQAIPYANIDALIAFLKEAGLAPGGTGPKVRPVVSCKGTTCVFGLIDTYALSLAIHERFYLGYRSVKLPHKFKIAVGGCPNNCVKPDLNDVGIVGQCIVTPDTSLCRACGNCKIISGCPMKSATLSDDKIAKGDTCSSCGRCLGKCPFGVFEKAEVGYAVYIGGRWGKVGSRGIRLSRLAKSEEEVLSLVESIILFYRAEGKAGERLADTVARIGIEAVEAALYDGTYLERKAEILG